LIPEVLVIVLRFLYFVVAVEVWVLLVIFVRLVFEVGEGSNVSH
jgi:hypothetical protein